MLIPAPFFDQFIDLHCFCLHDPMLLPNSSVKITICLWMNLFLLSYPFPHLPTFIASPEMSTQCLRKYFWIWLEKCYNALNISEYLVHYSVAWNIQVLAFQCCIFCLSSLLLGYDSNVPLPVNTPKYSIQACKIPNF